MLPMILSFMFLLLKEVYGGDYCFGTLDSDTVFCDNGCCGTRYGEPKCCKPTVPSASTSVAVTMLVVAGGILCLVIVIISVICVVKICIKSRDTRGRVIQPVTNTLIYNTNTSRSYPSSAGVPAPPPYSFYPSDPDPPLYGSKSHLPPFTPVPAFPANHDGTSFQTGAPDSTIPDTHNPPPCGQDPVHPPPLLNPHPSQATAQVTTQPGDIATSTNATADPPPPYSVA